MLHNIGLLAILNFELDFVLIVFYHLFLYLLHLLYKPNLLIIGPRLRTLSDYVVYTYTCMYCLFSIKVTKYYVESEEFSAAKNLDLVLVMLGFLSMKIT